MRTSFDSAMKICKYLADTPEVSLDLWRLRLRAQEALQLREHELENARKSMAYAHHVAQQRLDEWEARRRAHTAWRALPWWKRIFQEEPENLLYE